jgi:RNA polymerase sigma-70 factor (family 1)
MSYLKSNEAAEDVVQEVFLKIWKKRHEIDDCRSFQSYLFTIALNAIRKQFNKCSGFNQMKHDLLVSLSENREKLEETEDYQELLNRLEFFIGQMPERRREIFRKKKMEGKSLKEISEMYQITPKTVEYHITEAMKYLRKEFEQWHMGGMVFFFLFVND